MSGPNIQVGDKLPDINLFESTPGNVVKIQELIQGKAIIFGLPGAFTPICSARHLPEFVEAASDIRGKGVSEIICVSVNDPWVMSAWGDANKAQNAGIRMLADTKAELTKAMGLTLDRTETMGGIRSTRYAMLVENGVVKALEVEPDGTSVTRSSAENMLNMLKKL